MTLVSVRDVAASLRLWVENLLLGKIAPRDYDHEIISITIPLDVPCPICDAEVGELCLGPDGRYIQPQAHFGRVQGSTRGSRWRGPRP